MTNITGLVYYGHRRVVEQYRNMNGEGENEVQHALFRFSSEFITDKSSPILDLMGGCGRSSQPFRENGYTNLTIADGSEGLIEIAKERGFNSSLVNLNVEELPFEDESFDAVICCQGMYFMRRKYLENNVFREVFRVLRSKGFFIYNNFNEYNDFDYIPDREGDKMLPTNFVSPIMFYNDIDYVRSKLEDKMDLVMESQIHLSYTGDEAEYGSAYAFQKK